MKKLAGVPLALLLDIAPDWCTHITVHADCPDTFIFESATHYQAGSRGKVDGNKMLQKFKGDMCEYAQSIEHYKQILKDDTA